MKKNLCVVTGSRADYGLLYPLLKRLKQDSILRLRLAVTGAHLSERFGGTSREIIQDGFGIDAKVPLRLKEDTDQAVCRAIAQAVSGFSAVLRGMRPDMVVVLGDRFEIFAAAVAAFVHKVPIAHLYGGELTEGAMDDSWRHAITKMSYLHFTSTEEYRSRVIQLGESPSRVFTVGALGLDNIKQMQLASRQDLEQVSGISLSGPVVLATYHPVTLETNTAGSQFKELLKALDEFSDLKVIFTQPNADQGNKQIRALTAAYVRSHPRRAVVFESLGQRMYLTALRESCLVAGNSSSGLIEAPSFHKPTVNIGDRQKGRIQAATVIDCRANKSDIARSIRRALSPQFAKICRAAANPYGRGDTAPRIVKILRSQITQFKGLKKSFYDLH